MTGKRWLVESYVVEDYRDARQLAEALAVKTGRTIHLMEKPDDFTPAYSVESFPAGGHGKANAEGWEKLEETLGSIRSQYRFMNS